MIFSPPCFFFPTEKGGRGEGKIQEKGKNACTDLIKGEKYVKIISETEGQSKLCRGRGESTMTEFISHSEEETRAIAKEIASGLKKGDVLLLEGDLGAGKTVFAKGVAEGLGVEEEVTSPTYAYMNEYEGRALTLYHYDCYRVESAAQAEGLGLSDYFDMGGVCLVEWPQNIAPLLPKGCTHVRIEKLADDERRIVLS